MPFYSTNAERVWKRVKIVAAEAAIKQEPIDDAYARRIVEKIVFDENAQSIPPEARIFYARELQSMAQKTAT